MTGVFTQEAKPKARQAKTVAPALHDSELAQNELDRQSTRNMREDLASKTFWFMCWTAGFIGLLLLSYFLQHWCKGELVPPKVVITIVTTTFATIVGLVALILKGLFRGK